MTYFREISTVFAYELACVFRGIRSLSMLAVYLLGTGLVGVIFVQAYLKVLEKAARMAPGSQEQGQELKSWLIHEAIKDDPATADSLAATPAPVIFFFWFALMAIPLFTALTGFDVLSGELQHRGIRYLSMRVRRGSLLMGKLAVQVLVAVCITAAADAGLFLYAAWRIPGFEAGIGLSAMARFWVCSIPYVATYVTLTALVSAWIRIPILALMLVFIVLFILWILSLLAAWLPSMAFLGWGLPSHYHWGLYSVTPSILARSLAAYTGFSLLFGGLAWFSLARRDL